jgi:hypothetical protein
VRVRHMGGRDKFCLCGGDDGGWAEGNGSLALTGRPASWSSTHVRALMGVIIGDRRAKHLIIMKVIKLAWQKQACYSKTPSVVV